jgi:hypothetical protein
VNKIPVETTLVGAFKFLFNRIVSIVGTLWLPFVVIAALIAGLAWAVVPHEWLAGNFPANGEEFVKSPQFMALLIRLGGAYSALVLAGIVICSMMTVGVMRHALGLKEGTTWVYFSLGAPVWRLIAAHILGFLLILASGAVLLIASILLIKFAVPLIPLVGLGKLVKVLIVISAVCAIIYSALRLFFFLPAVVVAEERIGLGRSWELGGGNFWRMFIILLVIGLVIAIVGGIVEQFTVMPIVMQEIFKLPHGNKPDPEKVMAIFRMLVTALPYLAVIWALEGIASIGLKLGAVGAAYNAVTESKGDLKA